MGEIKIVTDSTADLAEEIIKKEKIVVVPLRVHFGDQEEFLDWVELKPHTFYEKLISSQIMPHTSQPSPQDFVDTYRKIAKPGDTIISIHISGKLSGTYQSAFMAKEMLPDYNIEVIDSKMTSMALGIVVIEAARAVNAGKNKEELMAIINYYLQHTRVFFVVETLEYLQKNGRIGKAKALLGGLLNVKPILTLDQEGSITPVEQARGRKKSMERIVSLVEDSLPQKDNIIGSVLHAVSPGDADILKNMLQQKINFSELLVSSIGSVIGSHVGPGLLAIAFSTKK